MAIPSSWCLSYSFSFPVPIALLPPAHRDSTAPQPPKSGSPQPRRHRKSMFSLSSRVPRLTTATDNDIRRPSALHGSAALFIYLFFHMAVSASCSHVSRMICFSRHNSTVCYVHHQRYQFNIDFLIDSIASLALRVGLACALAIHS